MNSIYRYDPKTDSWTIIANMSIGRESVGIGVLGDRLFAIGGYDGQTYLSLVEMYDPATNEWKQVCFLLGDYFNRLLWNVLTDLRRYGSISIFRYAH